MSENDRPRHKVVDTRFPSPELGALVETFRPTLANVIAGLIISALLFAGGLAAIAFPLRAAYLANWDLPLNVKKGWSWFAVGMFCVIGVIVTMCGVFVASISRGLFRHRVEMYENGFRFFLRNTCEEVLWTQVAIIRETTLYERPPVLHEPARRLLPEIASVSYLLYTFEGETFPFDGNSVKDIRRFGEILRAIAERELLDWETVEEHG